MTSEEFKKVFFQLEIDIDPETIMIWNYKQNAPKAVDIPVSRATAADIEMLREALKTDLSVCGFDQLYASEFGAGTQDFSYSMGNGSICISDEMPQTYKALSELYEKYRSDVNEAYAVYY